jgi:hypothetical protein
MTNFRIIGAATLALALALLAPAMAANSGSYGTHPVYHEHYRAIPRMSAQDFNHFDFGIARPTYHSGWGGPYGDGDYPGSIDQNIGPRR